MSHSFVEQLESRTFLSITPATPATPTGGVFNDPIIQADRQAVQDAAHQLRTDVRSGRSTIRADQQAVRTEFKNLIDDKGADAVKTALQPLLDQLRTDEKAKNKALRTAVKDLSAAKRTWTKTLLADLRAWRHARVSGDDQSAIDAAKKKLDDDKAAAKSALDPIRDNLLAVKDKWRPIITADHDAIQNKLEDLDPALKPLYAKLDADASSLETKVSGDQKSLADATDKLKTDLQNLKNPTANA